MEVLDTELRNLIQVDEICDEFEAAYRQGNSPRIEDYLARVDPTEHASLVLQLVTLEVELRAESGEVGSADELVARYAPLLPAGDEHMSTLRSTIEKALSSTARLRKGSVDVTAPYAFPDLQAPMVLPAIEGFDVESILGRGGMGIVFKATQRFPRRPVALKMILEKRLADGGDAAEFFERFKTEAQAIADLNDPHFVQIYQFGESEGRPYMALEFVEGGSLEKYRGGEPQPADFAARTAEQLARGMSRSHRAGVVHRDLKPHNVLLTQEGVPKITDFGLAKRLAHDAQVTQDGRPLGTPSYMAPEQTYGTRDVEAAADIYAIGGILYCLLTGRPPFQAATWRETFEQVCNQEPVPPSRLNSAVPRDLETICLKCLEKEPSKRYETADALADDLRRYQEGRPILARPVSNLERGWRWARRNPWIAGLGAGVAALLVAVTIVSLASNAVITEKNATLTKQTIDLTKAKTDLVQKNKELTKARDDTKEQLEASLELVRHYVLTVDDQLRNVPGMSFLRGMLIERALKGAEILRDNIDKELLSDSSNQLVERTNAIVRQRTGEMYIAVNRLEEAQKEFSAAHGILNRLYEKEPEDPVSVRNLAAILNLQGDLKLQKGDTAAAKAEYERALDLRERWAKLVPSEKLPDVRRAIAQSHGLIGRIDMMQYDAQSGISHLLEAKAIYDQLSKPANPMDAIELARERGANEQRLGELHRQLDRLEDAEKHLQAAINLRNASAIESQRAPALIRDLGLSSIALGDFYLMNRDDVTNAWNHYTAAVNLFAPPTRVKTADALVYHDYGIVQYRLGTTFLRARQKGIEKLAEGVNVPDPMPHFKAARDAREQVAKGSQNVQPRIEWALAEARCGNAERAEQLAKELEEQVRKVKDPYVLFQVACVYALCSENKTIGEHCRKEAFRILEELKQTGWKGHVALKKDPDLEPIRKDPRFAQLASS